ncbi:MAG: DUF1840 domain-containing protein [Methyloversatilis discipulorum]|jgi:hypothetical protein|uniref:DUF1840 domain-containing protein n=1 Tax=Methyloversatilis discipulorum TaxID=1119528 RepID=UPI0026EF00E6|nr:DUF1840 domain-containing protein [Methyloversatilis discipulorum]MBV5285383.1 DUF1840 domain-containing protein [Methyloversatilis discipulorum]
MIVTFKSSATADTLMFGDNAKQLLSLMGKSFDAKGIITLEQLPAAIDALKQAIAASREAERAQPQDDDAEDRPPAMLMPVSLAQRAAPLVEQLERSLKARQPVIWES